MPSNSSVSAFIHSLQPFHSARFILVVVDDDGISKLTSAILFSFSPFRMFRADDVKASGGKVLVHCHAGISRSATICMAYLMATLRLRMEDAYEHVKSRRKIISPNFSFMGQLLSFESQVFSPRGGGVGGGGVGGGTQSIVSQRSPRSPLTSLPTTCNNNNNTSSNNNNNSACASPPPRPLESPKTPSDRAAGHVATAFDFSISPSTLASLVNGSSNAGGSSPSPTPSPSTPLCPSSPYSP